jgi:adenylate cyclase, class 2
MDTPLHYDKGLPKETEIKLRVGTVAAARRLLRAAGFTVAVKRHLERNTLYDTRPPTLRPAGRLLRVRRANGETIVTFKGPAEQGERHKTREEIEARAEAAVELVLERVGFARTFAYEKFRTEYQRAGERGVATLDETPIGVFLELEGAPGWIDRTAKRMGFALADYLLESYGSLWAAHVAEHKLAPGDFVFPRGAKRRGPASK